MSRPVDQGDWRQLEVGLAVTVAGLVSFDAGTRTLYTANASNHPQLPIGVVLPRSVDDVIATVAVCASR